MSKTMNKISSEITETLQQLHISPATIQQFIQFESRDDFHHLPHDEYEQMQSFMQDYTEFQNLSVLMTNQNSDYWCIYNQGPLMGMICYLDHEESSIEPRYIHLARFLEILTQHPQLHDFEDLQQFGFDFPDCTQSLNLPERDQILTQLSTKLAEATEESHQQQLAFCIMALISADQLPQYLYPFLDSEDMFIQERAIEYIGLHQDLNAFEKIEHLTASAMHNGKMAAQRVLNKLRSKYLHHGREK